MPRADKFNSYCNYSILNFYTNGPDTNFLNNKKIFLGNRNLYNYVHRVTQRIN